MLQANDYRTYMTGKWHLGHTPELLPSSRGFDRTIAMADTGADNWDQRTYLPIYDRANWYADGAEHTLPDDFYSSEYFIDKTIEFIWIETHRATNRFLPMSHFRLFTCRYRHPKSFPTIMSVVYDEGWTVMRERRRLAS